MQARTLFTAESSRPSLDRWIARTPQLAPCAKRVLDVLRLGDVCAQDVARALAEDTEVARRVLAFANSAAVGLPQRVTSLPTAVALLGHETVRRIVVSLSVHERVFRDDGSGPGDRVRLWRHSLAVAAATEALARGAQDPRQDLAYLAGLLHDVGKAVLVRNLPEPCERAFALREEEGCPLVEAERRILGIDHADLGARLAERWGIEEVVCAAVRHHHEPPPAGSDGRAIRLAALVHVADALCWGQGFASARSRRPPCVEAWAKEQVRVDGAVPDGLAEAIDREVGRAGVLFDLAPPDAREYRGMLHQAYSEIGRLQAAQAEARGAVDARFHELTVVIEAIRGLWQSGTPVAARRTLLSAVRDGLGFERAFFLETEARDGGAMRVELDPSVPGGEGAGPLALSVPASDPFLARCLGAPGPFPFTATELGPTGDALLACLGGEQLLAVPLRAKGELSAVLLADPGAGPLPCLDASIESLAILSSEAGLAIHSKELLGRARELHAEDDLTSVLDRRHVLQALGDEVERARRYGRPLSVAMCDLDHFKAINDTYGHPAGDQVLRDVAQTIKGASRNLDAVGRLGGDEFVVVLPETGSEGSIAYAERVRKKVAQLGEFRREAYPATAISVSLGVATLAPGDESRERLIEKADQALYAAKQRGRNRACVFRG